MSTPVLVLGATGKTGRRVARRLQQRGVTVRPASRASTTPFSWEDPATWPAALDGVQSMYVAYAPDLAVPGAAERVEALARMAAGAGVRRLVLLSGRGEPGAERAEAAVRGALAGTATGCTILRASWFAQNFSESFMLEPLLGGELALPAGDVSEPFVDADDIADVAVAALLDDRHAGELYELTGPRALTFAEAVATIAGASGRPLRYASLPTPDFLAALRDAGVPDDYLWLLGHLFDEVLDGRNAEPRDGVQRALGRPPRDFAAWAREVAATGCWAGEPAMA